MNKKIARKLGEKRVKQNAILPMDVLMIKGHDVAKGLKHARLQHAPDETLADDLALDGFELAHGLRDLLK